MTDKKAEAEKILAENQKLSEESEQQTLKMMAAKPTPTQRESDLAALGVSIIEKEPTGAPKAHPKTGAPLSDEEAKKLEEKKGA